MSGGVDSSVAALLLAEQGYEVVGAQMKLWDYSDVGEGTYEDNRCCITESIADCRLVCDAIGAQFYVLDMTERFRKTVIEYFVSEYLAGRTPNPCVVCNSEMKWKALLRKAEEIDCNYVATGHYAIVEKGDSGRWRIRKGTDASRDQSYVLWRLSQEALSKTLLPLGGMHKTEVREMAKKHNLRAVDRPESREICFITDNDYRRFLREWEAGMGRTPEAGEIVHADGHILGRHNGTAFYTIGQRKGLGIAHPTPLYVQAIDTENNRVIVGDNDTLFGSELDATHINWVSREPSSEPFEARVKIRYRHEPTPATVTPLTEDTVHVTFKDKQRAITPGQSVVFYEGDVLLGGGIIA